MHTHDNDVDKKESWKKRRKKKRNYGEEEEEGGGERDEAQAEDVCLQHAVFFRVHIDNNVLAVRRTLDQL